ncbi:MAG TPA: NUDIX domain-containing protein [Puia sp.]|jgi:8-oxo-dGTP pyrophosphatase MutT (NUDIX family)|nr:NUDIX domain-containing protein [Puia sp.]
MENKDDVIHLLRAYLKEFETEDQGKLTDFLNRSNDSQLYDRKVSDEHITASALIINPRERTILLLKHKTFHKLLQPGGHIEKDDNSILDAAIREAVEETGIERENLVNFSIHLTENIPLDIDSHFIPENIAKEEPSHFHHDFRYLFFYHGIDKISPNTHDAEGAKWVSFSRLARCRTFRNLLDKIRKILSLEFKTKLYYDTVAKEFDEKKSFVR